MIYQKDLPVVTVAVVTYNSAAYIEETLESVWAQSYPNIELIISDDASTDNTVDICKQWLQKHRLRFLNTALLLAEKNRGVSANRNRAEQYAQGRYVKPLAGDDLLMPDAIARYVDYMQQHPKVHYLFGKIEPFGDATESIRALNDALPQYYTFFDLSAREQYKQLMRNACYVPEPSFFFDRKVNERRDIHYDERIPMLDDWPKWIRITRTGEKLHLLTHVTARYRIRSSSVSNGTQQHKDRFVAAKCQLWLYYQFGYHLLRHPRLALIKYIKVKQYLTDGKLWHLLERLGRVLDVPYRKLRHSTVNDWDGHYIY